jgi:hypothetical protein
MPDAWVPSSPDTVADGLEAWITALRARLTRGELRDLGPVRLSDGKKLAAELAVKLMLNDLDHFENLPRSWGNDPLKVVRRRLVLHDLQDLRRQLS